jgi:hypothetical protein
MSERRYSEEQYQEAMRRRMVGAGFPEEDYIDTDPDVITTDSGAHVHIWAWIGNDELADMGIEPEEEDEDEEPEEEDEEGKTCETCRHYHSADDTMICTNEDSSLFSEPVAEEDSCSHYEED